MLKEYYDYSRFSTCIENSWYFWKTIATEFLRKYRDSKAVALKEYYNYSPIFTYTESCRYFQETIVTVKLLIYKTRKRYVVIESLDFTRNIFWLASWFFKIKKPNSHFLGNQSGIAGFPIFILKYYSDLNFNLWICAVQEKYTNRKIQSKRVLGLMKNTHWLADHKK